MQAALPGQTFVLITAANPFFRAPPGTNAAFGFFDFRPDRLVGADHFDQTFRVRTGNATAGLDIALPRDFKATVSGTFNWSRNDTFQPGINTTALTAAAAGTTTRPRSIRSGRGPTPGSLRRSSTIRPISRTGNA